MVEAGGEKKQLKKRNNIDSNRCYLFPRLDANTVSLAAKDLM